MVAINEPFQNIDIDGVKFVPVTESVGMLARPAVAVAGLRLVIVGSELTVNAEPADVGPPGCTTEIEAEPADVSRLLGTVAVSCVEL